MTKQKPQAKVTRDEIKTLIAMLHAVYEHWNISSALVDIWHMTLAQFDLPTLQNAVRVYLSEAHEFAPKPGQIYQLCEKASIRILEMTPAQALMYEGENPLADAARRRAREMYAISPHEQFDSPEDLERAQRISRAQQDKAFKDFYDMLRLQALERVRAGATEAEALGLAEQPRRLSYNEQKVLSSVFAHEANKSAEKLA